MVVGYQWPDEPSAFNGSAPDLAIRSVLYKRFRRIPALIPPAGHNQALDLDIAINGLGAKIAAKGCLGMKTEDRHKEFAAIFDKDRPVIRQQFGEQRKGEAGKKDNQRDEGAPVAPEIRPAAPVQVGAGHDSLDSKSIRGSIQTYIRSEISPIRSPMRLKM